MSKKPKPSSTNPTLELKKNPNNQDPPATSPTLWKKASGLKSVELALGKNSLISSSSLSKDFPF